MKRLLLENQETTRMPKEAAELAMSMCQEKTSIQEGKFLLFWDNSKEMSKTLKKLLTSLIRRSLRHYNPKLSRFAVLYTCSNFTFTSGKAEKDFGFQPKYSGEKAIQDTIRHYSQKR
ncbi:MAG TPA: hypothetical protein VGA21_08595 [Cyclobacteriaceae bacterium]|jgi:hypothetical protein